MVQRPFCKSSIRDGHSLVLQISYLLFHGDRNLLARSLAGNLDSPQADVFLTSIIDGIVGVATYYMHHHAI